MGWWTTKVKQPVFAVCRECRVHFEPHKGTYLGDVVAFAEYCQTHRAPKLEAQIREEQLIYWVKAHLDLVEKLKAKEDKKEAARRKKAQVEGRGCLGANGVTYWSNGINPRISRRMADKEPQEDLSYLESNTAWFLPPEVKVIWWNPEDWRVIYGRQADG